MKLSRSKPGADARASSAERTGGEVVVQIKALKVRAAAEERQLSDVMREAVDLCLRRRP